MADEENGGFFSRIFGSDNEEARSREMVMSPPPEPPNIRREDFPEGTEGNIAYRMAKRKADFEYRKLLEDRELNPQNYMVPAAAEAAEPTEETSRYDRQRQLDTAIREAEGSN